jgi:hypothetical protein
LISIVEIEAHGPPRPYYRALRLGPRAFSVGGVDSLDGGFVRVRRLKSIHPATPASELLNHGAAVLSRKLKSVDHVL